MKDILLVKFPVDLGNKTIESNLHNIFENKMDFFRFAAQHADVLDKGVNYHRSIQDRLFSMFSLRKVVSSYVKANKTVLFNGLSPAFLSYGAWDPKNTAIVFDWTRLLYPSILGEEIKKDWIFYLHRYALQRCPKILCWTDAIMHNLQEHYGVKRSQLYKVPSPFLVEEFDIPPRPTPRRPRVLFVGGDLKRKGGDILLGEYLATFKSSCMLTMVTNDEAANIEGVNFRPGVCYGTNEHKKIYEEHDILVLPTRIDAYAHVLGEASAAGLAVVTTKYALGAPEIVLDGVSGYITETQADCMNALGQLIEQPELIKRFKWAGYKHMHTKFSSNHICESYLSILE
jgi:glycosyltransferase involved in cell wall biosynthesis